MLPSLEVKNFRLLTDFQVSKLGRVNLIVGKNNSGKSSVLEALQIYAGNAQRGLLEAIAAGHGERFLVPERSSEAADGPLPFEEFFSGREINTAGENRIVIGPSADHSDALTIEYGYLIETQTEVTNEAGEITTQSRAQFSPTLELWAFDEDTTTRCLRVTKRGQQRYIRLRSERSYVVVRHSADPGSGALPCSFLPTRFVSQDELADTWDKIALTDNETVVKEFLQIIAPDIEGISFVRNEAEERRARFQRTAMVKLSSFNRPVSLNSLGDGVLRVLQLVLKAFPARGGLYLIDEFENGLHFSVQEKVWSLLFKLADRMNIQIFATTHSWDCIESFARVAREEQRIEGLLFRVGRSVRTSDRGRVIATIFDEEQLYNVTQADVEVR